MTQPRRTARLVLPAILLILAGTLVMGWFVLELNRAQHAVYSALLEQKMATTRNEFRLLLRPFGRQLTTLDAWHGEGLLPVADTDAMRRLIEPLLDPSAPVAAAYFVPETGPALLLNRTDDGWRASRDDGMTRAPWVARTREAESGRLVWSDDGPLPGDGRTGLIAARLSGGLVMGLALPEATLDDFATNSALTENALLVRRLGDGTVAWITPREHNRLELASADELLTSGRPEYGVIGAALRAWADRGHTYDTAFTFDRDDGTWWCVLYPAEEGTDPGELALIVPADDLARRLDASAGRVILLVTVVLVLAVITLLGLVLGYRARWQRARRRRVRAPRTEDELRALVAAGENDRVEFKSTMRWNLRADKPGKEIELAWLKSVVAYMNTDGGVIVLGVDDDGRVLGMGADGFRNDDKLLLHFENLIQQHVGLEHAGRVRGELRDLDGEQVFLVSCAPADEPVFLRKGEDEDFYVRVGPSSRRLPASRVLDWTRERQA